MGNLKKSYAESRQSMKRLRSGVFWRKKRRRGNMNRLRQKPRRVDVILGDAIYERPFKVPYVFWTVTEAPRYDPYRFARSGSCT
jgi:hypothetical protein